MVWYGPFEFGGACKDEARWLARLGLFRLGRQGLAGRGLEYLGGAGYVQVRSGRQSQEGGC